MNIHVSIIIVNFNTFKLTCECIQSVLTYTKGVTYEIILIDNASTECDPGIFQEKFPSIVLVRNEVNAGFSKANNTGIALSSGEQVLLLNSDTYLLDDSISILYFASNQRPEVAVSTGKLIFPDGKIQWNCQRFPSVFVFLLEASRFQKFLSATKRGRILLGPFFRYDVEIFPDWVWGTFMMIRRSLIDELPGGKLNDDFFMYCEDIQWCHDFRNLGYKVLFTPRAFVVHLMGRSSGNKTMLSIKNMDKYITANYSPVKVVLLKLIYRYYY